MQRLKCSRSLYQFSMLVLVHVERTTDIFDRLLHQARVNFWPLLPRQILDGAPGPQDDVVFSLYREKQAFAA